MNDPHQLLERVLIENRVGVERNDVRCRGRIDPRVERVRLAPVHLVDHRDTNHGLRKGNRCLVHPADGRRGDRSSIRQVGPAKAERLSQPRERPIRRAIIDHDDLESRIFALDEAGDAVDDRHLLVVCGDDHGERLRQIGAVDEIEVSTK